MSENGKLLKTRIPFSGYSVKFSPFAKNVIGVASSQYFGIAGNGRVSITDFETKKNLADFTTRDGCFDLAFSEASDRIIAAACGDGVVRLFDTSRPGERPAAALTGHAAETYSVDFNFFEKNFLCSASWDKSVRVFDTATGQAIYGSSALTSHAGIAYEAKFSPKFPAIMASVGGDGKLLLHDIKMGKVVESVSAHNAEILCVDFNKYRDRILATGSVDRSVKIFDLRNSEKPLHVFNNHQLAVRRVKFSPHSDAVLCSCSYDTSVKVCSVEAGKLDLSYDHHSEFVLGIDFSIFQRDLIASTGWDRQLALWTLPRPSMAVADRNNHRPTYQRL